MSEIRGGGGFGNAPLALTRLAGHADTDLSSIGLAWMRDVLMDEQVLKKVQGSGRDRIHVEMTLRRIESFLQDFEPNAENRVLVAALNKAIDHVEYRFHQTQPVVPNDQYNDADYLQKKYPAEEEITWGQPLKGLRVGVFNGKPFSAPYDSGQHGFEIYVQNVSQNDIRFGVLSGTEALRVAVYNLDDELQPTQYGDVTSTLPITRTIWSLRPSHMYHIAGNRLEFLRPDDPKRATGMRRMDWAITHVKVPIGEYKVRYNG